MTTLQSIVYAIVQGLTFLIPVGSETHPHFIRLLFGWELPPPALLAAIASGIALALLVYFRHDWPSFISSLIQVILFRKKPMTLDERMPFFLALASIPVIAMSQWSASPFAQMEPTLISLGGLVAAFALPLWFFDSLNRRTKKLLDWNTIDASLVGIAQIVNLVPGAGSTLGAWLAALFRNYQREAAAKFVLLATFPVVLVRAIHGQREVAWGASAPAIDLSWMSFGIAFALSFFSALLSIGALLKAMERRGQGQYAAYRVVFGGLLAGIAWWKLRNG